MRSGLLVALLAVLLRPAPAAGQPTAATATPAQPTTAVQDPEAEIDRPAPVLLGGDPVIWVTAGAGPYTPQFRAERISLRVHEAVLDRLLRDPTVTVTETGSSSELRAGSRLLMVVTERDARSLGIAREVIAQQYARELEAAIRAERRLYAPATLIRSAIYGLLATLVLVGVMWLIHRLTRAIHGGIGRWLERRREVLHLQAEIISADSLSRVTGRTVRAVRFVLFLLVFQLYVTFVLGLFPWTRAASSLLLSYVLTPIRSAGAAFVGYLPKLLFVIVIGAIIYCGDSTRGPVFQPDSTGPHRVRELSCRVGRSDEQDRPGAPHRVRARRSVPVSAGIGFPGVCRCVGVHGVLISLASSSALSNMIAGIVLTYTGAFRLGDRVKLGDSFGDIVETSLLATHVRTIKNEDITIPNSVVLSSSTINYSRSAGTLGLILHTSVTIGYDAPWRKVHDLLIEAALATKGVLQEPAALRLADGPERLLCHLRDQRLHQHSLAT